MAMAEASEHGWTWADLSAVVESNLEGWDAFADVFAGALRWEEWFAVYAAVRGLQQLTYTALDTTRLGPADHEYISSLIARTTKATVVLTVVGVVGPGGRTRASRRLRRLWWKVRPPFDEDELLDEPAP
jgi:hypothetical protein